jgi:hypothetical protein
MEGVTVNYLDNAPRNHFLMRPLDFSIDLTFQPHYGPGVDSASSRNEFQESSWGKGWLARKADSLTAICEWIV